ncbi:SDR family NAD(P)-dependent oxidoreductase [Pseudonocardia alni]|jgi:short-subunit dehydrogenase|uniref:Short-subunit dehydrogenase n=1 Tax=Pseudonocardia alni TaxID=33907 RepID=A0AA44UR94_PSEA5|nr:MULTISPECIES: SDR family NAD(P)-dependent oxidoreductase [Pseudonocardia]MYW72250.1 SDR family NAD(P)-dependent oxidoreductase [Pseudonocardia sp. SID8383]OJG06397.1 putative oxidoreductase SadH [Pseudonocardia autotrophica]PKB31848.1 short-subunit dehydrogenase [Pseudonocardia alni]
MKSFTGRTAAITGAGSGIGRALALRLAGDGCHLALADRDAAGLAETAALAGPQVRVTTAELDVSDEKAVYGWADAVVADHGAVHMIVNNAGVALSGTTGALSLEDYRWIMDINFWGVVYGTKAFLPHMETAGTGHVVNLSSIFGVAAQPLMSGYNASKYAVRGFTESLRQDLELTGSPVSATCVHPGGIRTNIAKAARVDDSVAAATGRPAADATAEFERMLTTTPDRAAKTILDGVQRNQRRVLIGPDAWAIDSMVRLLPTTYQRIVTGVVRSRRGKG